MGKVLGLLEEHKIIVVRDAVEIVRKTKSGYNIYTRNYIIFLNVEKGSAIIRPNHYAEGRRVGKAATVRAEANSGSGDEW